MKGEMERIFFQFDTHAFLVKGEITARTYDIVPRKY